MSHFEIYYKSSSTSHSTDAKEGDNPSPQIGSSLTQMGQGIVLRFHEVFDCVPPLPLG